MAVLGYTKAYRTMKGKGGKVYVFHSVSDNLALEWTIENVDGELSEPWLDRDIKKVREHIESGFYVEVSV